MTFIALHRGHDVTLGTQRWLLTREEATACTSAAELLGRLEALHDARQSSLDAAMTQSREAGYAAGHREALQASAEQLLQAWQNAAERAQSDLEVLRQAVISLSVRIVRHIAPALAASEVVSALVSHAVQDLPPDTSTVVRVHPETAAAVREHLQQSGRGPDLRTLEIQPDADLDVFGCVLETPTGQLLAGLDTQLDNIARSLASGARKGGVSWTNG